MRIISWNACGINKRNRECCLEKIIDDLEPDILCIQETKSNKIPKIPGYADFMNPTSVRANYGTAIYTIISPLSVEMGIDDTELDSHGRVIRMEFDDFYLFNIYAPPGSGKKEKFELKSRFYEKLNKKIYESDKPVIICGDFNRISKEIDAECITKSIMESGFAPEEQKWFREILTDYVDAFRKFNKQRNNYTWWSNIGNGFRFDYFLVSNSLENKIKCSDIFEDSFGSDHRPIVLDLY